jgi:hypothetical protein
MSQVRRSCVAAATGALSLLLLIGLLLIFLGVGHGLRFMSVIASVKLPQSRGL